MDENRRIERLKYEMGIPEMDAQHEEMAIKLGAVTKAIAEGDTKTLAIRLDELIIFTAEHFRDEEQVLENANYGALPEHRRQHVQLSAQLHDLKARLASGKESPDAVLADSLWVWFSMHVLKGDRLAADRIRVNLSKAAEQSA